jgi:hypothetical protein
VNGSVRAIAVSWGLLFLLPATDAAQPALDVVCSASSPIVYSSTPIQVRAWRDANDASPTVRYRWAATVGTIGPSGAETAWTIRPDGSSAAPYRATVRAEHDGRAGVCTVEVWPSTQGRGPSEREAGKMMLAPKEPAPADYGLYSYLLLGSAPTDTNRERYVKTIGAWWSLLPDLVQLEQWLERRQLNAALLPVLSRPSGAVSPLALLDRYDYARARVLLRAVGRSGREGPYLVSSLQPLNERATVSGPYLVQDLSSIPPSLAVAWTKEFLSQTSQERFWDERTVPMFGLRMRTTVRAIAETFADVRQSVHALISWEGAGKE